MSLLHEQHLLSPRPSLQSPESYFDIIAFINVHGLDFEAKLTS